MATAASAATSFARSTKASAAARSRSSRVNDLGDAKTNAHLTRYDTAHGPFQCPVEVEGDSLVVDGDKIKVCAERDPAKLPWKALGVDFVLECTGLFTSRRRPART